eukprot:4652451-Alexandrium_andersonii.AAC.1
MRTGQPVGFTPPPSPRAASSSSSAIPPERQRLRPVGRWGLCPGDGCFRMQLGRVCLPSATPT